MRLLLDTHFLIWLATEPGKLTKSERAALSDPNIETVFSALSIWEIRIKWNTTNQAGVRKGRISPESALRFVGEIGTRLETPGPDDFATASIEPALGHRDPFDEMLIVHARQLRARLLTRDAKLRGHPLAFFP